MQHTESSFQIGVVRFLRSQGFYVFAVPNGGNVKLTLKQGAWLKKEGLLSGVSDLIIVLQNRVVFAELKNPNGTGRQSENQKQFEREVVARGHEYLIWESWAEVETFVNVEKKNKGYLDFKLGATE